MGDTSAPEVIVTKSQVEEPQEPTVDESQTAGPPCPIRMKSAERVYKLPVVEETLKIAINIYGKVRGANFIFNWSLKTVEHTAAKAAETTAPLVLKLQRPIEVVDGILCVGLDCVESNIPAVKLPPHQIYENTKQYMCKCVQLCVNCTNAVKDCSASKLQKLRRFYGGSEPAKNKVMLNTKSASDANSAAGPPSSAAS